MALIFLPEDAILIQTSYVSLTEAGKPQLCICSRVFVAVALSAVLIDAPEHRDNRRPVRELETCDEKRASPSGSAQRMLIPNSNGIR